MDLETAETAIQGVFQGSQPHLMSSNFVCPHCRAYAQQIWGGVQKLETSVSARTISDGVDVSLARCSACKRESVFIDGRLVHPAQSQAPNPAVDLPEDIRGDYDEASRIVSLSPRGAAALLRLAIQKLCPHLGSNKPDINAAIGELVALEKISKTIQQALDSVRVIGNEAVHPGQMDLKDDAATALALFKLINFIVEKAITEPKEVAAIYASLPPNKLEGIVNRDAPKA